MNSIHIIFYERDYSQKKLVDSKLEMVSPHFIFNDLYCFFLFNDQKSTFRYRSMYLQPELVNEAYDMASKNETVTQKLGDLSPYNFLRLIEGDVIYSNNDNTVEVTVNLLGTKKKGKLDIIAHRNGENWKYQKITVRIKKPKKEAIIILKK